MNKKYTIIILGIFFIAITGFSFWHQSEDTVTQTFDEPRQDTNEEADNASEETDNQEEDTSANDDTATENSTEESFTQMPELFREAVQQTIQFFTNRDSHVTAVGDSLTQGVGDDKVDGGYVGILDNTINNNSQLVTFENYGKRGNRSNQLLKRLDKQNITQSIAKSDIVMITIGANDIMQVVKENFTDLSVEDFTEAETAYEERLNHILDRIKTVNQDADIYLVGVYNPFENYFQNIDELGTIVKSWNETSRTVTEQYDNTTFIPIADLFNDSDEDLFAEDNFHPNHQGYQLFAKRVLAYITEN